MVDYVDQGMPVDAVYLDFQKTFDKVSHEKLVLKMKRMGVGGWDCAVDRELVVG